MTIILKLFLLKLVVFAFGLPSPQHDAHSNFLKRGINAAIGIPFANVGERFAPATLISNGQPTGDQPDCSQVDQCLVLNVLAPSGASGLPVMLFFYGGSFISGNIGEVPGESVVDRSGGSVIFVAANYRTGPFGFLASTEAATRNKLNVGLRDQDLAIQWVQDNIERYGGDPNRVTLWGQSAGAVSVSLHVAKGEGGFSAAIMESGSPTTGVFGTTADHNDVYQKLIDGVGCGSSPDSYKCLQQVPAGQLTGVAQGIESSVPYGVLTFCPVIDNDYLENPYDMLHGARVPMLLGTNANDGEPFDHDPIAIDPSGKLNGQRGAIAALYGGDEQTAVGDMLFRCPAEEFASASSQTVFKYFFNEGSASHGDELAYTFGNSGDPLDNAIFSYWIQFAKTHDPNSAGLPKWPAHQSGQQMYFNNGQASVIGDPRDARCSFWAQQSGALE